MAGVTGDLLAAASELLATDGPSGLSLRRVAEAAGCSTMAIYSRFGGKSGLFAALAQLGFENLAAAQAEAAASTAGDPIAQVHAICGAHAEFARADPLHYRLMFEERGAPIRGAAGRSIELLGEALARVSTRAPAAAAQMLFAMCHGVIIAELAEVIEPSESRLRAVVELTLAGLD